MKQRRVVITGIGTINPLGNSIEEYFTNLEKGVSGAGPITHFDPSNFKTKFACELKGYEPNNFFDRKEVRKYDLYSQYALIAAEQAVQDSGIEPERLDLERVGVIWGSGIGGLETFYQEVKSYVEGGFIPRYSPFFIPKMIADLAAGHISMKYGFRGPNYCTVSACASSNHAMIDSLNYIRWGKADMILTGGSEAAINPPGVGGFNSMQALSTRNDDPQKAFAAVRCRSRRVRDRRRRRSVAARRVRACRCPRGQNLCRGSRRRHERRCLPPDRSRSGRGKARKSPCSTPLRMRG